jgi:cytochrome c oxidase assembly protein subunit 11
MPSPGSNASRSRQNRTVVVACLAMVVAMAALAYASVPLYRLFCQVTGYGGTTQRVAAQSGTTSEQLVTVRFDANTAPGLPWTFEAVSKPMTLKLGATAMATYRATSRATVPTIGTAAYNVVPDQAGSFFNKLACFCFTEQTLAPGQSVDMPVQFFVDPAMALDSDGRRVREITLSYTFFPVAVASAAKKGVAEQGPGDKGRGKGS